MLFNTLTNPRFFYVTNYEKRKARKDNSAYIIVLNGEKRCDKMDKTKYLRHKLEMLLRIIGRSRKLGIYC